tara:strand:+ start:17169 stop:17525 length:357 start_codon:yes stop_codon:yes gene_type:complete
LIDSSVCGFDHELGLADLDPRTGWQRGLFASLDDAVVDACGVGGAESFEDDEPRRNADPELLAAHFFVIDGQVDAAGPPDNDRVTDWNAPRLLAGFADEQLKAWHCDCGRRLVRSKLG